jgi:hypothetical protein
MIRGVPLKQKKTLTPMLALCLWAFRSIGVGVGKDLLCHDLFAVNDVDACGQLVERRS